MLAQSKVFAVLPAEDINRAKQFYADKLDLTPSQEVTGGFMYECADGTMFFLYETQYARTAQNTAMGWLVDDLDESIRVLTDKGIVFEKYDMPGSDPETGIVSTEGMRAAWFKDTEGNILNVAEAG